jgi:hypothetical protein
MDTLLGHNASRYVQGLTKANIHQYGARNTRKTHKKKSMIITRFSDCLAQVSIYCKGTVVLDNISVFGEGSVHLRGRGDD